MTEHDRKRRRRPERPTPRDEAIFRDLRFSRTLGIGQIGGRPEPGVGGGTTP